jgi:hypothetical protein
MVQRNSQQERHSVLDGREYIGGLPRQKSRGRRPRRIKQAQPGESVLSRPEDIDGFPSDKKSALDAARSERRQGQACISALDGPQCIDGIKHRDLH